MAANEKLNFVIQAFDKTKGVFNALTRRLNTVRKTMLNVKTGIIGLAGVGGFGLLLKSTVETNAKFQSLEATLKTFLGTTAKASQAFKILQEFAAQTPFSVDEVVTSFNKMIALGLNPTVSALEDFGNIASGTGKSLEQFIEAAADAAVGEFERLKEFGIKARSEGDKVTFTFNGVETSIRKDAASIQTYLQNLGKTKFAGATAEQANTLRGAFSNLGDAVDGFQVQIGKGGLNQAVSDLSTGFSDLLRSAPELATSIGAVLGEAISSLTAKMKTGEGGIKQFAFQLSASMAESIMSVLMSLQKASDGITGFLNVFGAGLQSIDLGELIFDMAELAESSRSMAIAAGLETGGAAASIAQLDEQMKNITGNTGATNTALTEGQKALKNYAASAQDVEGNLQSAALNGVKGLEDGLTDVIMGAKSAKEAFKSMAASIVRDLIKIAIQKQITGALSGLFSGFGGGGSSGGAPITASSGNAIGGSVQRGRATLVGERGPELFIPSAQGGIVPNHALGGQSGDGVTINQTINVSTGVSQTVRAEIASMLPQIQDAAKMAVVDAKRRGGSFSKALR